MKQRCKYVVGTRVPAMLGVCRERERGAVRLGKGEGELEFASLYTLQQLGSYGPRMDPSAPPRLIGFANQFFNRN